MVATPLKRGSLAIISVNTDTVGAVNTDSITFILLEGVGSGTQIFFTDRTWTPTAGSGAVNAGSFSTSGTDGTFTWTAAIDLAAGSTVTITAAQLAGAGMDLSDVTDTIYVYQGTNSNTPTSFLYAFENDGAVGFQSSLVNTGLDVSLHTAAITEDNGTFGDITYNTNTAQLLAAIHDTANNWTTNVNSGQAAPTGASTALNGSPTIVANATHGAFDAPSASVWFAQSGVSGIGRINDHGDGTGVDQMTVFQNSTNPATQ